MYETIRGAADFLDYRREPRLEERVDGYLQRIAAAQDAAGDGYLNTYVTLRLPSQRWGSDGGD